MLFLPVVDTVDTGMSYSVQQQFNTEQMFLECTTDYHDVVDKSQHTQKVNALSIKDMSRVNILGALVAP